MPGGHGPWRWDGRRPPPWWPEGEAWPPQGGGHWTGPGPRRTVRRAGCALSLLLAVLGLAGAAAVWLVASALGIVASGTFARLVSVAGLLLGAFALVAAVAAGRRLAAPAGRLVAASGRIEAGDLSVRVPVRGPAELRSLARAFNAMSSRLEATEARRRSVVAEVAHELRTPLSIIRGQAEAIADGVYTPGPERMVPILDAVRSLEVLVDDLTTLGLAEAGALRLRREPVDLAVLVHDTLETRRATAAAAGVTLVADLTGAPAVLEADPARLRGVLSNLVGNAVRHSVRGGSVRVVVRPDGGGAPGVELRVVDEGEGIPAELLPHVLERFVKGEGSPGSGLGLAIVRDVVEAHGGSVEVASVQGEGTTVTLHLPG
ncbi:MAG: two-component system, OmpR family, sensor histidine kinase BaeS [Chloroflexota bacterium]|nr:two-component system, OmpR family, sensor histidine kinase BaeS [Chloroflexota bacterium]